MAKGKVDVLPDQTDELLDYMESIVMKDLSCMDISALSDDKHRLIIAAELGKRDFVADMKRRRQSELKARERG